MSDPMFAEDAGGAGKVVTFYSFKGGTGRTMALANVAWILASTGKKVLVLDWDLDSPGLHRYFQPFLDPVKVAATPGIIELITDYAWEATQSAERSADWVRRRAQIVPHAVSLSWEFPAEGMLDFVSAGRQNRDYSAAVTAFDWDTFYERLGGGQFLDALRDDMKKHYDYVLIDSRTGHSDISDICTVHLPDILVDCFTLNNQSIDGAATTAQSVEQRYHYRNIQVLPVPMRIDEAEKDKADVGLALARIQFRGIPRGRTGSYDAHDYWNAVAIPYKPFYAFEETLAVFGDAPRSPLSLLGAYERLAHAITDGEVSALGPMTEDMRLTFRAAYIRPRQPPPGDIYLSYVPEDRVWADWVAAVLAQRGIQVVRSPAAAAGGSTRDDAARTAESASRTIALLSAAYLQSPQAHGVWEAMGTADPVGTGRRLIPIRVGEIRLEQPFSERSVVDLTRRDAAQATEDLLRALGHPPKLADQLTAPEPRYPRTIPPVWHVPTRNASFTGRNEILEKLHDQLTGSSTPVVLPVALTGLGGVGKTQVALEYAHRFMADYDLVWWVEAEQSDRIDAALASLAPALGVRAGDSTDETAELVKEALRRGERYDRWLLIYDNADEPSQLAEFLPGGPGHVVVTSRNPTWAHLAEPVPIDVFPRRESLAYLLRRVPSLSETDAELVAGDLGDLPLALEHAAAWLAATGLPAAQFLTEIHAAFEETMALSQPSNYPTSVAGTFRLSFERLRSQSPAAARLLELCACFAADPISLSLISSDEMIAALTPLDRRLRATRNVLGVLLTDITRYSLARVDREVGSNSIQMHRLIQLAILDQMDPNYREERKHEVHMVLAGARPRQGDTDDPGNWARYGLIWPHLAASEVWNCDNEEARQLLIDYVRYLWKQGDFEDALRAARRLEAQWIDKHGEEDEKLLSLRFNIANVLRSQGQFAHAYQLDTEVLASQRELLGEDHLSTLVTAGGVGGDLRGLGRFREALDLDEQTYRANRDLLGPDDPGTLSSANNLAIDYRLVGDPYHARDLDEETLGNRQDVLGSEHPYTLHSASMLARDMREAGEYQASAELLEQTYAGYRSVLGDDFLDTMRTGKSLAVSLRKMGDLSRAYALTRNLDERYTRLYGADHLDSLACRLNLAADLSARDEKGEAYATANTVLRAYEETLGRTHPFTLVAENNMSTYLRGVGEVGKALAMGDETLAVMLDQLGENHPSTLSCQINRANCLCELERYAEAEVIQRDTAERLRKTLRANHPDTYICEANLAIALRAQGRDKDAHELQQRVIQGLSHVLGSTHPNVESLKQWRLQNRDLEAQPT
jgi:hypothetical protein